MGKRIIKSKGGNSFSLKAILFSIFGISLAYIMTLFLLNLWEGIWCNVLGMPISYLGYIFFGIAGAMFGLLIIIKNAILQVYLIFSGVFSIVIALEIIFPQWYQLLFFI